MNSSWILKKLFELVQSVDMYQSDPHILLEEMYPHLKEMSDRLHTAALHIHLKRPDAFGDSSTEDSLEYHFAPFDPLDTQKISFCDDQIGHDYVRVSIYPCLGYRWSDEERMEVSSVVRVIMTEVNRACMVRQLNDSACTDILTGIYNRFGAEYFGNQILAGQANGKYTGCYVDLKKFKLLNEQYGYATADAVLRAYAEGLQAHLEPEKEIAARIGCDRFLLLCRAENLPKILDYAKDVSIAVEHKDGMISVPIGAWIGIYPIEPGDKISVVLPRASFAAEEAKKKRQNVMYFSRAQMDCAIEEKEIARMLPDAIRNGEIKPYYQPKVRLSDGTLYGSEALARWEHGGERISPSEFVLYAERGGIVYELDHYILECVCRDIRGWLDAGIEPVCISVNYSQQNFCRESLVEDTLAVLRKYGVDGKYIEIEITETSFLESPQALTTFVEAMHMYGVRVSLDDFGVGYSSLSMFRRLSLDTVKLDKSFFDDLHNAEDKGYLILQSITEMIHRQNAVTVAEGIENVVQLQLIRDIGGNVVQGFLFDHPLPKAEFEQRLKDRQYHKSILEACLRQSSCRTQKQNLVIV